MNEQTKHLIESQLASYRLLEPIKISDTVHSWLNMLNRIVDVCNIVEYPDDDLTTRTYSNLFGFMTSVDKFYLDGIKSGIFPEEPTEAISIEIAIQDIYISNESTENRLEKFLSLIQKEKYSSLSYQDLENNRKRIYGRSDLVRTFLRDLGIELDWNEISDSNDEEIHWTPFVDVKARNLNVSNYATKKAKVVTVNKANPGNIGTITVNMDSKDVQCINAVSDVMLQFAAAADPSFYCEKLISIKAEEEIRIFYSSNDAGSDGSWKFVNNSIYPNVEWSNQGVPTGSLLLKGTFIVYKATFIHSRILLEVIENSQLVDNYKAASTKYSNSSFNGTIEYDATSETLNRLTSMIDTNADATTCYIHSGGAVSSSITNSTMKTCVASFELACETNAAAQWSSVSLLCCPVSIDSTTNSRTFVNSDSIVLQEGRHMVQILTKDTAGVDSGPSMIVKIDYALNKKLKMLSILGFTTISLNNRRFYDE